MFHSTPTALLLLLAVVLPTLSLPAPSMAPSPSASSKPKSFSADLNTTDSGSDYSPPVDMNSTTPQIIAFHTCLNSPSPAGVVNAVTVMPCERANGDEPCRFRYGVNYTIAINYTSYLGAENPKQTLEARDDTVVPSLRYPYSGQSFNACEYTKCPILPATSALFTYEFNTLQSPFNNLQFNMTQTLNGPSILCVGMAVQYLNSPPTPAYGNSTTR